MKALEPGVEVDGFLVGQMMHKGGMALIYETRYADGRDAPFPMVMKVPRMTAGDGAETIVSFEVEHQMMQALDGPHVPYLVAAGDLSVLPYLVMEYVPGRTLDHWLDQTLQGTPVPALELARLGAAVANAAHDMHQQNAVHLDLKPATSSSATPPPARPTTRRCTRCCWTSACPSTPTTPTCWPRSCARPSARRPTCRPSRWWACAATRAATCSPSA